MIGNATVNTSEETVEEKDLGVWTDDELKFVKHIENTASKSNQILGLIKRSFVYKNSEEAVHFPCPTTTGVWQRNLVS